MVQTWRSGLLLCLRNSLYVYVDYLENVDTKKRYIYEYGLEFLTI